MRSPTFYEKIIGRDGFTELPLPGGENLKIIRIMLIFVLLFISHDLLLPYWQNTIFPSLNNESFIPALLGGSIKGLTLKRI